MKLYRTIQKTPEGEIVNDRFYPVAPDWWPPTLGNRVFGGFVFVYEVGNYQGEPVEWKD